MQKTLLTIAASSIVSTASASILILDDFNDDNLATGGVGTINPGVSTNTNGAGGSGSHTESGGSATITTSGNSNNSGLNSITTFNGTGQTSLTVSYVIAGVVNTPASNGIFLGLASDNGFYRNSTTNLGFQLSNINTFGSLKIGFTANDGGTNGSGTEQTSSLGAFTLAELQDGFSVEFTVFDNDTFTTTISGLGDADGTTAATALTGVSYSSLIAKDNYTAASV